VGEAVKNRGSSENLLLYSFVVQDNITIFVPVKNNSRKA
jgi:hypothetical protein